ncbi:MAG: LamG-like jellyroll fold domain-containing protein [Aquihabitans sp.]
MIAERLILWHRYRNGAAFDLSENRNHGRLVDVGTGGGSFPDALHFSASDGAVRVDPSPTLSNLREVRAQVHFHWDPTAPGTRRHNLVEGHLAFALFIHPDASLHGTILNQLGSWEGAVSAPGVVPTGGWHTAEFVHDGIAHASLYLDGQVVAEGFSSPGPVRSVGPNGVAIGHWPEISGQYTFEGYIDEVKVWCDDPTRSGGRLIDDCCIDREAISAGHPELRSSGLDAKNLGDIVRGILDVGRQTASHLASGSRADRDHATDLGRRFLLAYETGDQTSLVGTINDAADLLVTRSSETQRNDLWEQLRQVMAPLPGAAALFDGSADGDELRRQLEPWCLDGWLPRDPERRPHRRPESTVDLSVDPHTDVDLPATEPGDHEQASDPTRPGQGDPE